MTAINPAPKFALKLASSVQDVSAAQQLRYRVFVRELGGSGEQTNHDDQREADRFDPFCDHLLLLDLNRADQLGDQVVGVYRLMDLAGAKRAGGFYTQGEYDLSDLLNSGRPVLELGRSCLDAAYRGGPAMYHLWNGLSRYALARGTEVLFGTASFHGTDVAALAPPLSLLHHNHLAPVGLRPRALATQYQRMDLCPASALDPIAAIRAVPALIKAYLRLGGCVGDGAFVDHAFNTTDVCLILDTAQMTPRQRSIYTREVAL